MEIDFSWTTLALLLVAVLFFLIGLGTGNAYTKNKLGEITACPLNEIKIIPDKPCSEETLNDCLRVFRTVHKLGECAENKYCEGLR